MADNNRDDEEDRVGLYPLCYQLEQIGWIEKQYIYSCTVVFIIDVNTQVTKRGKTSRLTFTHHLGSFWSFTRYLAPKVRKHKYRGE